MNLQYRIDLLVQLGKYISENSTEWQDVKERAGLENGWFIPEFVEIAVQHIASHFLQKEILQEWVAAYNLPSDLVQPKTIGIVMAGNIPLVGFHDWLCVFISGNRALIKPSSKDQVLIKHLTEKITEWDRGAEAFTGFADMLKGCHAYIATGSNHSSRYFEYYFGKYPHIIRRNKSSVAILRGDETFDELEKLADDVHLYFGLGCRNVTKIYVPAGYDFSPLLDALKKYSYLTAYHKYKNNYDYNLALHLLNKKNYMTNGSILLVEEASVFAPIAQLNYEFYQNPETLKADLLTMKDLQCIVGRNYLPFGKTQYPTIRDYADGVDTLAFLKTLKNS